MLASPKGGRQPSLGDAPVGLPNVSVPNHIQRALVALSHDLRAFRSPAVTSHILCRSPAMGGAAGTAAGRETPDQINKQLRAGWEGFEMARQAAASQTSGPRPPAGPRP